MILTLSVAAAISAALAVAADAQTPRHRSFYVLKPLTTLLIIAVAATADAASTRYQSAVLVGLTLSLAGDVCLMFEGERWFAAGLLGFLLAHLAFIIAFTPSIAELEPPAWSYAVFAWGAALQSVLWRRTARLRLPVLVYGLVLASMFIAAASLQAANAVASSFRAVIGAGLFVVSDSLLSIQQFVRPYAGSSALILVTYWSAIWLIAVSV